MTNYFSNEVTVFNSVVQIDASIDSKFILSANYGLDASSTPTFDITKNTTTGTVTVSNSTSEATPDIYWTYTINGGTPEIIQEDGPFSFSTTGQFSGGDATFNCTLTINEDAAFWQLPIEDWGNIEVHLNVSPYTEGEFTINTTPVGGLAFVTDWDLNSIPSGVAFYPNLSNQLLTGNLVTLSTVAYSYESIASSVWEYSDDNKVTWSEITSTQGQVEVSSSSETLQGYGDVGQSLVSRTLRSESLGVSDLQFSEGRFYRVKVVVS